MDTDYDVTIVGSGFGGALLAMIARRLGLKVALLERGSHPRFAIGESTSPLMNLLLEQLALRYDLPRLLPLTTYGAWQRTYPELGCGLKRGFTYFHHQAGQSYRATTDRSNQLMVAASPNNDVADTHWLRSDVDHFFVQEAVALGVDYLDHVRLEKAVFSGGRGTLEGERKGKRLRLCARLVVDATGPRGFLSRALGLPESEFAQYPATQALYTHFTEVRRCDAMDAFRTDALPPYPIDDAALHHVFDGGWMWVLRFGNGLTSAGIAVTDKLAQELGLEEGEAAWMRMLRRFPTIAEQFAQARPIRPFVHAPRLAYRTCRAVGEGWLLLPSAAAFVDPLFSTGMPLTLLGIERLGRILEDAWETSGLQERLNAYDAVTLAEADWTARFLGGCYAGMGQFSWFSAFSMFYFASASYAEMARRLEQSPLQYQFLAANHGSFAAGLTACAQRLHQSCGIEDACALDGFQRQIANSIRCLNIAGLCDPCKHNWYRVDLTDLIRGADKLGLTSTEMSHILASAPWAQ